MDVNRRFFMAVMAGAGMDPERLLWIPGRKMISIAAPLDVVPVEVLFGMPDLMPFNVPLTERVRAMLAIDPSSRFLAEGSGTVRFTEAAKVIRGTSYNGFSGFTGRSCSYDGHAFQDRRPILWPGTPT